MPLVRRIKDVIQGSPRLRRLIHDPYLAVRFALPTAYRREWVARIADVLACPDLADIPRVADAGRVRGGVQTMHNGLRVIAGGYYGYPLTRMMRLSGGVHEPQEEKAFAAVLPFIPPGGVMIEPGAYWAFYSMWFNRAVPRARNFIIEPLANNLDVGRANFRLNGMPTVPAADDADGAVSTTGTTGTAGASFHAAAIGRETRGLTVTVDDFLARQRIDFVHLLHADVQGYELDMLDGAARALADRRIGYVFISTHSESLHRDCRARLERSDFRILCEAAPAQSYSFDGLLVARGAGIDGPDAIAISRKPPPPPAHQA